MPKSNKSLPGDKPLPKPVRYTTSGVIYRRFTWRERWQILVGYSAVLEIHIATEQKPGRIQPLTKVHLTPEQDEKLAMEAVMNRAKAEQKQAGIKTEPISTSEGQS